MALNSEEGDPGAPYFRWPNFSRFPSNFFWKAGWGGGEWGVDMECWINHCSVIRIVHIYPGLAVWRLIVLLDG